FLYARLFTGFCLGKRGFSVADGRHGTKARMGSAVEEGIDCGLRSSREVYERQVTTMGHELDGQVERNAGLPLDQGLRLGARRDGLAVGVGSGGRGHTGFFFGWRSGGLF